MGTVEAFQYSNFQIPAGRNYGRGTGGDISIAPAGRYYGRPIGMVMVTQCEGIMLASFQREDFKSQRDGIMVVLFLVHDFQVPEGRHYGSLVSTSKFQIPLNGIMLDPIEWHYGTMPLH